MNHSLKDLLDSNRDWAARVRADDPDFFKRLSLQQAPKFLWIGCSDSRVPANQILGMAPGEVFVHRNIANVVVHADLNCLSAIQFAVDLLRVEHILVVGHYGCGGVHACLTGARVGLADNWLRHVGDVAKKHADLLTASPSEHDRHAILCELNAIEQAASVCESTVIEDAWARGQQLAVHGLVYDLLDGRIRELGMDVDSHAALHPVYESAIASVHARAAKR